MPHGHDQSLAARDLAVNWHPASRMRDDVDFPPLGVVAAEGCRLKLADGREVLDAISSWWCKSLGHGHPRLRAAMAEQAARFEHVIFANTTHENAVRLSERLLAMGNGLPAERWGPGALPGASGRAAGHFGKVFYADNGSTAVEVAMKMAVQAQSQRGRPRRMRFAALRHGYHGETCGAMSVGDYDTAISPFRSMLFPVTFLDCLPYRSGPTDARWLDASDEWPGIEAQLEGVADDLAAIVYEPVLQGAGGMLLYSPDLLPRLRAWADAHEVYLIADEIAAGFGRLGAMLATHLARRDALPDFAVLSKGLTGGFTPLSAVLTTDGVYALFDGEYHERKAFMHSNTYTGHALGIAVALAALDVFVGEDVLEQVTANGPRLYEGLMALAQSRPYLHRVRGCGLVAAVDIRRHDGAALDWKQRTGYQVYRQAVSRGALLRPLLDTMYLFPPLNTEAGDIDRMLAILADSLDAVMRGRD